MHETNTEQSAVSHTGLPGRRLLLVVAAESEARAVRGAFDVPDPDPVPASYTLERLSDGVDLIVTGVGKAQAAGGVTWAFDPVSHQGVLSIGIGGVLPAGSSQSRPEIGEAVLAPASVFGDEGLRAPDGFRSLAELGFPPGSREGGFGVSTDGNAGEGMPCHPAWRDALGSACDRTGIIATVSACSGTDAGARDSVERTGAGAENMEGAAVAAALSRRPLNGRGRLRFAEIRVISNTTGDRANQVWELPRALDRLGAVASEAARALLPINDAG